MLSSNSFKAKKENEEANHFDVSLKHRSESGTDWQVLLLFLSVCFDAVALMLVSTSTTWKHALVGQSDLCMRGIALMYQDSVS